MTTQVLYEHRRFGGQLAEEGVIERTRHNGRIVQTTVRAVQYDEAGEATPLRALPTPQARERIATAEAKGLI